MDLVGFDETVFNKIREDYLAFSQKLHIPDIRFIPLSALKGDNVVNPSTQSPWYTGPPLLELLDTIEIHDVQNYDRPRFPVQYVNRPNLDFRGYSGTVASGVFRVGDAITVLPSGASSQLATIVTYDGPLEETFAGQAVTLTLEDEIDISRGDVLVRSDDLPTLSHHLEAHIVWMTEKPLTPGQRYLIKHNTRSTPGVIDSIQYRIDVNTQTHHAAERLQLNEIGLCDLTVNIPLAFDAYSALRGTGAFIIVDRLSNITIGAGLLKGQSARQRGEGAVSSEEWAIRLGQRGTVIQVAGEKSTLIATKLERQLFNLGHISAVLNHEESLNTEILRVLKHMGIIAILTSEEPRAKLGDVLITDASYSLETILKALSLNPKEISAQTSAFDPKI
jgi:bifunctional enzyme CysN/CysC